MKRGTSGQLLLIGLLLFLYGLNMSRVLFLSEESPVFLSEDTGKITVELGAGFPEPGIHQYIDGTTQADVIRLTHADSGHDIEELAVPGTLIRSGDYLDLEEKTSIKKELTVSWMSASKRIALGIPLHPDRMGCEDWTVLPGIGTSTAVSIEKNRQKYGEFGSFYNLVRVPGIGEKRLNSWNQYFFTN